VNGTNIAQNNQMGGFQNNTWTPGQQAQPQAAPVQQAQVVDPAYLEWQRSQAAAAQAAAQQQAPVAQPVPQAQPQPAATQVLNMPSPFAGAPAAPIQAAPSSPTTGRDDTGEDPLPF
jgi:hypothetical protein